MQQAAILAEAAAQVGPQAGFVMASGGPASVPGINMSPDGPGKRIAQMPRFLPPGYYSGDPLPLDPPSKVYDETKTLSSRIHPDDINYQRFLTEKYLRYAQEERDKTNGLSGLFPLIPDANQAPGVQAPTSTTGK